MGERALLDQRTAAADRAQWLSFAIALTVSAVATLGLTFSMISMALTNRRLAFEITERLAAEEAQRRSEARYRAIFANSADLLSVVDVLPDGHFQMGEVNPAYERATGATSQQLSRRRHALDAGARA